MIVNLSGSNAGPSHVIQQGDGIPLLQIIEEEGSNLAMPSKVFRASLAGPSFAQSARLRRPIDEPSRRLRPEQIDGATALELAKAYARAERDV
jgi:hypothetical protein